MRDVDVKHSTLVKVDKNQFDWSIGDMNRHNDGG